MTTFEQDILMLRDLDVLENNRPDLSKTRTSRINDQQSLEIEKLTKTILSKLVGHDINKLNNSSLNKIRLSYQKLIQDAYVLGKQYNSKLDKSYVLTNYDLEQIRILTKKAVKKLFGIWKFQGSIKESFFDIYDEIDNIDFDSLDDMELDDLVLDFPEIEDLLDNDLLDELYYQDLLDGNIEDASITQQIKNDNSKAAISSYFRTGSGIILTITGPKGYKKQIEVPLSKITTLSNGVAVGSMNKGTLSNSSNIVQFVTRRDSKVCPICEDLDMEQFDVDPLTRLIDGPTIPDDIHPNCRCRYLSLDEDEELLVD